MVGWNESPETIARRQAADTWRTFRMALVCAVFAGLFASLFLQ
jgi:hypothetical protein